MASFIDIHTHHNDTKHPFSIIQKDVEFFASNEQLEPEKFYSIGIHPWNVHKTDSSIFESFKKIAAIKNIIAIGECGLDKNSTATIKEQDYFFERQIIISESVKKPVIIHCVAAFNEIIQLRKKLKPTQNWVIHGFRGKPQLAQQLLDAGFALSFGEKFNPDSVKITPADKLCIETDESLLPISEIYRNIARVKNCLPEELNAACRLLKQYVC